jgi:hypothetical protein
VKQPTTLAIFCALAVAARIQHRVEESPAERRAGGFPYFNRNAFSLTLSHALEHISRAVAAEGC